MNSVTIIVIIVVLLACLVCYALISQTIEQRRQKRQRLLAALQIRAGNLRYMLHSLPEGFLSRDLALFVERTFMEACEQIIALDPKNPAPRKDLQTATELMNETRQRPNQSHYVSVENPGQVKDIKQCLEELYKVVHQQEARDDLNPGEAETFRVQIRNLLLGVTVDAYILHGHQARHKEKLRLAEHYFSLALKLLQREDAGGIFEQKKARLKAQLDELAQGPQDGSDDVEQAEIEKAWERFNEADDSWKKKNLYD